MLSGHLGDDNRALQPMKQANVVSCGKACQTGWIEALHVRAILEQGSQLLLQQRLSSLLLGTTT